MSSHGEADSALLRLLTDLRRLALRFPSSSFTSPPPYRTLLFFSFLHSTHKTQHACPQTTPLTPIRSRSKLLALTVSLATAPATRFLTLIPLFPLPHLLLPLLPVPLLQLSPHSTSLHPTSPLLLLLSVTHLILLLHNPATISTSIILFRRLAKGRVLSLNLC